MGWTYEAKEEFVDKYVNSRRDDCPVSDEEIMMEVNSVRYKK